MKFASELGKLGFLYMVAVVGATIIVSIGINLGDKAVIKNDLDPRVVTSIRQEVIFNDSPFWRTSKGDRIYRVETGNQTIWAKFDLFGHSYKLSNGNEFKP